MAASLAGSLKALIEAGGLGIVAYRDTAGSNQTASKWVTIAEGVATTTERLDTDDGQPVTELVQVDLWQPWRATTAGGAAEDYDLADQLCDLIDKAALPDPPVQVKSCTVDDCVRLPPEEDRNLVHHAITVRIRRERT